MHHFHDFVSIPKQALPHLLGSMSSNSENKSEILKDSLSMRKNNFVKEIVFQIYL